MDVDQDNEADPTHRCLDLDTSLLNQFQSMGTTDREVLVNQFQKLLNNQMSLEACAFYLDMNNWNLSAAVCAYFDFGGSAAYQLPAMSLVKDVTIGEGLSVRPEEKFEKIFKIQNSGHEPWPSGCSLIHVQGCSMSTTDRIMVNPLSPKNIATVTLTLTSPSKAGFYQSQWRMSTPTGLLFGEPIWVIINVDESGMLGVTQQLTRFAPELTQHSPKRMDENPDDDCSFKNSGSQEEASESQSSSQSFLCNTNNITAAAVANDLVDSEDMVTITNDSSDATTRVVINSSNISSIFSFPSSSEQQKYDDKKSLDNGGNDNMHAINTSSSVAPTYPIVTTTVSSRIFSTITSSSTSSSGGTFGGPSAFDPFISNNSNSSKMGFNFSNGSDNCNVNNSAEIFMNSNTSNKSSSTFVESPSLTSFTSTSQNSTYASTPYQQQYEKHQQLLQSNHPFTEKTVTSDSFNISNNAVINSQTSTSNIPCSSTLLFSKKINTINNTPVIGNSENLLRVIDDKIDASSIDEVANPHHSLQDDQNIPSDNQHQQLTEGDSINTVDFQARHHFNCPNFHGRSPEGFLSPCSCNNTASVGSSSLMMGKDSIGGNSNSSSGVGGGGCNGGELLLMSPSSLSHQPQQSGYFTTIPSPITQEFSTQDFSVVGKMPRYSSGGGSGMGSDNNSTSASPTPLGGFGGPFSSSPPTPNGGYGSWNVSPRPMLNGSGAVSPASYGSGNGSGNNTGMMMTPPHQYCPPVPQCTPTDSSGVLHEESEAFRQHLFRMIDVPRNNTGSMDASTSPPSDIIDGNIVSS